MQNGNITYRLKNGKNPESWGLKMKNVSIEDEESKRLRFIDFFPGAKSIWADENEDRQSKPIVFENNGRGHTEVIVPKADKVKNEYLQKHPWFNRYYEMYSEEIEAESKLSSYEKTENALKAINESDSTRIRATTMAIFGLGTNSWSEKVCRAELKEAAFKNPDSILKETNDVNYEYKFMASLAICHGIIGVDSFMTKVHWTAGSQGTIVSLAKGENPIEKLTDFIALDSPDSRVFIQEVGARIKAITEKKGATKLNSSETDLSGKDLSELQSMFQDKFNKELPARFKNEKDWIIKELTK